MKTHHCACGCGTLIPIYDNHRRKITWAKSHHLRGTKLSLERRRRLSEINLGKTHTIETRLKISKFHKGRKDTPESFSNRMNGFKKSPKCQMGPTHQSSLHATLRDPIGRVWTFVNLRHFVRENGHLFSLEDAAWTKPERGQDRSRAYSGLRALFAKKNPRGTWKGWTVAFSIMERAEGCGDLLGRDCATVVKLAK